MDILWISAMAGTAIERASSLVQHWERRLEFCRLHVDLRFPLGTETCAKWTAFLSKFEAKLSGLRMRRTSSLGLRKQHDWTLCPLTPAVRMKRTPNVAERFAALFAESERRFTSASETSSS